jgi:hypothetical protein
MDPQTSGWVLDSGTKRGDNRVFHGRGFSPDDERSIEQEMLL